VGGREPMRAEERDELAAAIEATLRSTPGVRSVYRSGSLISNLLRAGAEAIGVRKDDEPIVSVVAAGDGVAVEATLGVDSGAKSAEILRTVHAAIDALLGARGMQRESITLTVAHVQAGAHGQAHVGS